MTGGAKWLAASEVKHWGSSAPLPQTTVTQHVRGQWSSKGTEQAPGMHFTSDRSTQTWRQAETRFFHPDVWPFGSAAANSLRLFSGAAMHSGPAFHIAQPNHLRRQPGGTDPPRKTRTVGSRHRGAPILPCTSHQWVNGSLEDSGVLTFDLHIRHRRLTPKSLDQAVTDI